MTNTQDLGGQTKAESSEEPNSNPDAWLQNLRLGFEGSKRETDLYARYIRALALLCECAPFVDDEDYVDLLDELLADACKHYPVDWYRDGDDRAIAVRSPIGRRGAEG